jgi:hypothetical protein
MKTWLLTYGLIIGTPPLNAQEFNALEESNLIVEVGEWLAGGEMSEAVALDAMKGVIERAKKHAAAHKPMDPRKLADLLSSDQLITSTGMIEINDAPITLEPLEMVRRGDLVTVSIGTGEQLLQQTFSLTNTEEPHKSFNTHFSQWKTLVEKTVNAPPISASYAKSTPEKLLSRAGDLVYCTTTYISFSLKTPTAESKIIDQTGTCREELRTLHNALTRLLRSKK